MELIRFLFIGNSQLNSSKMYYTFRYFVYILVLLYRKFSFYFLQLLIGKKHFFNTNLKIKLHKMKNNVLCVFLSYLIAHIVAICLEIRLWNTEWQINVFRSLKKRRKIHFYSNVYSNITAKRQFPTLVLCINV